MAKILAVDDNEDNVFLLKVILENHQHEVLSAYNGFQAIEIAENNKIDLVLLDLMMPEMNGMEVAARLKSMESTRHVPIILLTAKKKEVKDVVAALDSGADEYLTKPFHETELVARVKSMLRMKSLFDQITEAKRLMEEDLKTAQNVQESLLPTEYPYTDRMRIHAYYEATSSLGGDYYDVVDYGNGKVGLLIADVSGHGASAALIVSMIKTIIISHLDSQPDPKQLVELLNIRLLSMIPEDRYFTIFLGILDLNTHKMTYARAGHPYPLLMKKNSRKVIRLDCRGDVVGLFPDITVEKGEVDVEPGDRLFTYSDGLYEIANNRGQMFGLDKLHEELEANFDMDGDSLIKYLISSTRMFSGHQNIEDDVAVLLAEII
ncbi:MAG: SpoIIE family protein phosphatase [Nitrospinota bacterium]|nr:SpoIIE family protein phosphatase [Nitrospinota bacterium]MDH5678693.1 SpoIIE family protein phosphatase [Nitrospinota bacterium]MDH5757085.1 SpoIIE family protein phosphatase [Nitrospinota bacterium]